MMILTGFRLLFNYYLTLSREPPETWVKRVVIKYPLQLGSTELFKYFKFLNFVSSSPLLLTDET